MTSTQLEETVITGDSILLAKRYIMAFGFLWFWDYALTLKDEVDYAWKGRKSWVFTLFLLNRYWPLPYLIWAFFASWWPGYSQKACDRTAFLQILYFSFATLFAQTTLTLRIYVVTGRNKLLTAIPGCVTLAQFFFGCYLWVRTYKLGARVWPAIDSDSFRLCFFNETDLQQIIILSFSLVFDLLAFLIVVWASRKSVRGFGRSKFPTILDKIVKDATAYFLVIFTSHLLLECFVIFAPRTYHLLPANSNAIFIPIMATRLMLSLKKAADRSGSFTRTEDLDAMTVIFAHKTMEYAMEVGVSRRDRRDQTTTFELENRTRSVSV